VPADQPIIERLPTILDWLGPECSEHFDLVKGILTDCKLTFILNPRLVRGLDYYTRTTFEFTHGAGPRPRDGASGTIEETAAEVTERGGTGIAVRADLTDAADVTALFERVVADRGRLDLLANAVWGAADGAGSLEEWQAAWGRPFWEQPAGQWRDMMSAGPYAYWLAAREAARIMAANGGGLIVGVTDGIIVAEGQAPPPPTELGGYIGNGVLWDLAHVAINRMLYAMSVEAKKAKIAVLALMPGFMRTERVVALLRTDEQKKMMRFDLSESPEYLGRAVAALAADRKVLKKTGRIHLVADLAREYGFTDVDGRVVPRFAPFGGP
jgi:NAD(P)-dependent dehydrogenase (short-subunit alcohol dehydrogenase family)